VRLSAGRKLKLGTLKKSDASTAIATQDKQAFAKYDLIVSTPMRLLSLVRGSAIDLSAVEVLVLDEVDKLLELSESDKHRGQGSGDNDEDDDEGDGNGNQEVATRSSFLKQVDEIIAECTSESLQRGLFSATIGPFVRDLAASFLNDPVYITIGTENASASTIDQKLVFVGREDGKLLAIRQIIQQGITPPVLIFLQSKERAKDLYRELVYDAINVEVIHSEKTSQQREDIIKRFRIGDIWVLICTDLIARGVDFKGVKMVINFDLPQSAVAYIHRIGRTGRAGNRGTAITLFT
jgi:ATP-dependent RNA helicase DDX52/ROK1